MKSRLQGFAPFVFLLLLGLMLLFQCALAVEILPWQRLPLAIPLVVGEERVVFLDKNVRVAMDGSLAGKLRVQSAGGALYLLANEAIAPSRLQVQAVDTGELILLDVATIPKKAAQPLEAVRIVSTMPANEATGVGGQSRAPTHDAAVNKEPPLTVPVSIALTRYAAQSLYAPLRTLEPLAGALRVPITHLPAQLPSLLAVRPVVSTPLIAFRLGQYQVTAVQLTNQSAQAFALDARELSGRFVAATFQHGWLGAAGTPWDTSVVYLVTQSGGLEKHLLPFPAAPVQQAGSKTPGKHERDNRLLPVKQVKQVKQEGAR